MQLDHQLIIDLINEAVASRSALAREATDMIAVTEQLQELTARGKVTTVLSEEYLSGTWDDVGGLAQALAGVCNTNLSAEATAAMAMPILDVMVKAARALDLETCFDPNDRPVPF